MVPPKLARPCNRAWPVYEDMGMIFVWWHPHKAAPLWELSPVTEIADEGWIATEYRDWVVDIPVQELTENGADIAHFAALHGTKSPPVPELKVFLRDADWMGIQRHLKILGIFSRLHYRDGKTRYLPDVPRFIRYLDEVLPRYPELDGLRVLLDARIKPVLQARGEIA